MKLDMFDFDVKLHTNEDKETLIKYLIKDKEVSENSWYKLRQDCKEQFEKSKIIPVQDIEEDFTDEELGILEIIYTLRDCDDGDALELLDDIMSDVEEDAFKAGFIEGIENGVKSILRQFTEQMNQIIYSPINIEFNDDIEDEFEFDE